MEIQKQPDVIAHLLLSGKQVYGVALSARATVQAAKDIHGLSKTTTAALGRLMMAALVIASDIKAEGGDTTVSFDGGGPAGRAIAVADPMGRVRVMASNPSADLPIRSDGKLDVSGVLGDAGRLTVIKDDGAEPYVGQVRIQSGEVAEDLAYYYAMSEQRPCLVFLGVMVDVDESVASAGGLALFPYPECDAAVLDALERRVEIFGRLSSMLCKNDLHICLQMMLEGLEMEITEEVPIAYHCPCSRERMERALISMGKDELSRLIDEDGEAELVCHFCNKRYHFDQGALQALLASAGR